MPRIAKRLPLSTSYIEAPEAEAIADLIMENQTETHVAVYQLFIKQFNGKTLNLKFTTPSLQTQTLINQLRTLALIPNSQSNQIHLLSHKQLLRSESTLYADPQTRFFPSLTLWSGLLGGKGGFGSLLRGAATKAGQKKTNNFDACRDMSGRRLRHVNAEKKLEEWKEGEEERKLERVAEEFLKKKAKSFKGSVKGGDAEKYVAKYREESAKCVAEVVSAVREVFERERKRKGVGKESGEAKKLKIWLGKRKIGEDDDSSDEEDEKSDVTNNQDSPNKGHDSTSSVSDGGVDGDSSGGSPDVGVENNDVVVVELLGEPDQIVGKADHEDDDARPENKVEHADDLKPNCPKVDNVKVDMADASVSIKVEAVETGELCHNEPEAQVNTITNIVSSTAEEDTPINFNDYNTAAEMEVLGMDRLKSELQARGLKCGGTLHERAARLFLLKTTPIEKLPKKLFLKK